MHKICQIPHPPSMQWRRQGLSGLVPQLSVHGIFLAIEISSFHVANWLCCVRLFHYMYYCMTASVGHGCRQERYKGIYIPEMLFSNCFY